jgi:CubicO group peptidase (beta-lactamase class C family)
MPNDAPDTVAGSLPQRLDRVIDTAIAEQRIVGAVVLVAIDGEPAYRRAAGFADREAGTPMRENTIFRLASVTKPIVSAAALSLAEAGALHVDDPVTRHLPDFRPRLPDGTAPVIAIRHLMTHTAGLSYGFLEPDDGRYHRAGVSDGLDQPGLSLPENLRRIASVPLSFAPGAAWRYSVATDVLGAVVAAAGGASLPEIVRARVTKSLGMKETAFSVVAPERLAAAYADGAPRPMLMGERHGVPTIDGNISYAPGRIFDQASYPSGGAGMAGTAGDILVFLECLQRGGAPILTPSSVAMLTRNAIGRLQVDLAGPGWGFGLGVSVLGNPTHARSPQSAGTFQWGGAYGASWFVDPERRISMVALTNTAIAGMIGDFPNALRDAVYGPE